MRVEGEYRDVIVCIKAEIKQLNMSREAREIDSKISLLIVVWAIGRI